MADVLRSRLEPIGMQLVADEHRNLLGFWPGTGELSNEKSMPIDELNCLAEVCAALMLAK